MDLTKDALQFIQTTAAPAQIADGSRNWTDKKLFPIVPQFPPPFVAQTLSGFLALIKAGIYGISEMGTLIQISAFNLVELFANDSDEWERRQKFAQAAPPELKPFPFSQWMDHETFVIGLQSLFVSTPDLVNLVKLASNLTTSAVHTSIDDGVSQELAVKRGMALKGTQIVKSRVLLEPFRTFSEIDQPASEFVFRARGGGDDAPPQLALFEADGGAWKLDAMKEISAWFQGKTTIPVIS